MTTSLILGSTGMIGQHLVHHLKSLGHTVIGADRYPTTHQSNLLKPDEFYETDLTVYENMESMLTTDVDEVYHLAAEMGGAGYIFTGNNDADIMTNSVSMTVNLLRCADKAGIKRIFYSSSACVYPEYNQLDPLNNTCEETTAYPAAPDSEYGWEKLFAERLLMSYAKNKDFHIRIARLHNVFGTECSWNNGREKAPAALCRKVAQAANGGIVDIWGPGTQTRSFLYVDECIEGICKIMNSEELSEPVNLGSEEMISINDLALLIADVADKKITINNRPGPLGVMGRNSHNMFIHKKLGWKPTSTLRDGIEKVYAWIANEIDQGKDDERPV